VFGRSLSIKDECCGRLGAKGSDGRVSEVQELVPLRTDFDVVMRGFRRDQVRQYVRAVEEELRLLTADRDANAALAESLTAEVEQLRVQNARLTRQIDAMSRTPVTLDALPARMRRMVELAKEEAAEITARAQAAAEHSWAAAEEAAGKLRARYADALAEMDRSRREVEVEHRAMLQQARVDASTMTTEADRRRKELDDHAARRRERVESDFEMAMAKRRAEAMHTLAKQKVAATNEAARLVSEAKAKAARLVEDATSEAERLVHDGTSEAVSLVTEAEEEASSRVGAADREVVRLRDLRGRIAEQLRGAREVLAGVGPLMEPVPAEGAPIPEPRVRV
jgi:cell division septum initiation protein DivIVA